jgi:hypothetical protein
MPGSRGPLARFWREGPPSLLTADPSPWAARAARWCAQSAFSQRAAASALSSGRALNAIAASGAALCTALIAASNIDRLWGNRIKRVHERVPGLFGKASAWRWRVIRTSNSYVLTEHLASNSDFQTGTLTQGITEKN